METINVFKNCVSISVATVLEVSCTHMYKSLVFGFGLHLKSHQRCSAGIRTWDLELGIGIRIIYIYIYIIRFYNTTPNQKKLGQYGKCK